MPLGFIFWVCWLITLVILIVLGWRGPDRWGAGVGLLLFILITILGWAKFGPLVQGG